MLDRRFWPLMVAGALMACDRPSQAPATTPDPMPAPRATAGVAPAPAPAPGSGSAAAPFRTSLEFDGIRFLVVGGEGRVRIEPAGLEVTNEPVEKEMVGTVAGAEAGDLNSDGSPEIYVYIRAPGGSSVVEVVGWSANRRKSLSEIFVAPLQQDPVLSAGHLGGDEYAVRGDRLVRSFPLVGEDGRPTGAVGRIEYRLEQGEASWRLAADRRIAP